MEDESTPQNTTTTNSTDNSLLIMIGGSNPISMNNITTVIANLTKASGEMITKYIPPISLTRCQEEREIAKEILEKKIASSAPVHVSIFRLRYFLVKCFGEF